MTLALLIGDTHIPERASVIPEPMRRLLTSRRFELVMCTGDLTSGEVLHYLQGLGGTLHVVSGNMDYLPFPPSNVVRMDEIKVGLTHGAQVHPRGDLRGLAKIASDMRVDVLVTGHTHRLSVDRAPEDLGRVLLLNPGSATGVWGGGASSGIPSVLILEAAFGGLMMEAYELKPEGLTRRVVGADVL